MRMGSAYVFTGVTLPGLTLYKPDTSLRQTVWAGPEGVLLKEN